MLFNVLLLYDDALLCPLIFFFSLMVVIQTWIADEHFELDAICDERDGLNKIVLFSMFMNCFLFWCLFVMQPSCNGCTYPV